MASSCFLFQPPPPVPPLKLFAIAWLATALVALAAPVAIGDHRFEGNSLSAGGWSNNLGPEWLETAGPNSGSGFEEWINGFSADGTDHLGTAAGHDVWQDLAVTYQANTRYTLELAPPVDNGDGTETVTVGSLTAYPGLEREFLRLGAE